MTAAPPGGERCGFCGEDPATYGCAPGRCLNPRPRPRAGPATFAPAPAAGLRFLLEAPRAPKGPVRLVTASELRDGPQGGAYWVLELECGHTIYRYAGRAGKRRRSAPPREQCLDPGCGSTITVPCAGGCKRLGDLAARAGGWAWVKRAWWCPQCFPVVLGWTADALGPGSAAASSGGGKGQGTAARAAKRGRRRG